MAAADEQLQWKEKLKLKLMRESKAATPTEERIDGDMMIGELIQKLIILIPMAVDLHGRLGSFIVCFLFGSTLKPMTFRDNCKNAEIMHQ